MEGFFKYLLENFHVLGILLIVTIIAVKLFTTTRKAKKYLSHQTEDAKLDKIMKRLEAIEKLLTEKPANKQ